MGDWHLMLATAAQLSSAVTAVLAIIAIVKVRSLRAEVARLRKDLKRLSLDVQHLFGAEQGRRSLAAALSRRKVVEQAAARPDAALTVGPSAPAR